MQNRAPFLLKCLQVGWWRITVHFPHWIKTVFSKQYRLSYSIGDVQYPKYVQYKDQEANDLILRKLLTNEPIMISKFGTIELDYLSQYLCYSKHKYSLLNYIEYISGLRPCLWWEPKDLEGLCSNAGFFPNDKGLLSRFYDEYFQSISNIDILGSYIRQEKLFDKELEHSIRVNLDGYYAPFFYNTPWTKALEGKKVLVVHPFSEDIQNQYKKKEELWNDKDILPDFELITYQSVQSILGIKTPYASWFDALAKMKNEISKIDFDIALIGCGAYGMPLASFIKNMGKQAIHLAGWTQILFGIIGKRWEDNPNVATFFNESWIHPSSKYKPQSADRIEQGCYW